MDVAPLALKIYRLKDKLLTPPCHPHILQRQNQLLQTFPVEKKRTQHTGRHTAPSGCDASTQLGHGTQILGHNKHVMTKPSLCCLSQGCWRYSCINSTSSPLSPSPRDGGRALQGRRSPEESSRGITAASRRWAFWERTPGR